MKIRLRTFSVSLGLLLIGAFTGFVACGIWEYEMLVRPRYTASWSHQIANNVALIHMLENGDTERVIELLEMPLEGNVLGLAYGFKQNGTDINVFKATIGKYSEDEVRGLQIAKKYHAVSDSWKPSDEVLAILDALPAQPARTCGWRASGVRTSEETPKGLSTGQFEYALRNISTAPNYVVVVIDGDTGKRESVCMEAPAFVEALCREHSLKRDEAVALALAQPDRVFSFSDARSVEAVSRTYSEQILQEARDFLAGMTTEEIEAATANQQSEFYQFCAREPEAFRGRFAALAHVLSERGILCARGCKPGLFHIDTRKHNKALPHTDRESATLLPGGERHGRRSCKNPVEKRPA